MLLKWLTSFFTALVFVLIQPTHAIPEFKIGTVIFDEEINSVLIKWISELFRVAGLKQYQPRVYLIVNPELNAAASVGGQILIHTGLIQKCENVGELLGVLAHEVGHIAGGHISKIDEAAKGAMLPAAAALLLGGAAALASGNPAPFMAGLSGSEHLFNRGMLKFTRTQESSADQAAMAYLDRLGWGANGLLNFFKVIEKTSKVFTTGLDPYSITHPLTIDRIKSVEEHIIQKNHRTTIPPEIEADFYRIKAKIVGFFESPKIIQNPTKQTTIMKNFSEDDRRYAQAIALYREGKMTEAVQILDKMITTNTNNPYLPELRGQILLDFGKHAEAIKSIEISLQKRPNAKYIKILLAHALLESNLTNAAQKAKKILIPVTQEDTTNSFAWRLLAIAHGKLDEKALTSLALAEEALSNGKTVEAKEHALRAKKLLNAEAPLSHQNNRINGPATLRIDDILKS